MSNRLFIKYLGTSKSVDKMVNHLKYIGFRSRELNDKGFFDQYNEHADYLKFVERVAQNHALQHTQSVKAHRMVFSLNRKDYDAYVRSGKTFEDLTRDTLKKYEEKEGVKLDWIAAFHNKHEPNKHPHIHIVIKGVSDIKGDRGYKRIYFKQEDFKEMKSDFDKEFYKDVQYRLDERLEFREAIKEIRNDFSNLLVEQQKEKIENLLVRELSESVQIARAIKHYDFNPEKLQEIDGDRLYIKLIELSDQYPSGKIQFDDLNEKSQELTRDIVADIFIRNNYDDMLKDYLGKVEASNEFKDQAFKKIIEMSTSKVLESVEEVSRKVYFNVDEKKLDLAIDYIRNMEGSINFDVEKENLLERISIFVNEVDPAGELKERLNFLNLNNGMGFSEDQINNAVSYVKKINLIKNGDMPLERFSREDKDLRYLDSLSDNKKMQLFSNALAVTGYDKDKIESHIVSYYETKYSSIEMQLTELKNKGIFLYEEGTYSLTEEGKGILLEAKKASQFELKLLSAFNEEGNLSLDELVQNKAVYKSADYLYKKEKPFEFTKYDATIIKGYLDKKELKTNDVTFEAIERKIHNTLSNSEDAEKTFNMVSGRIDKLIEFGFIEIDKENNTLHMTERFRTESEILYKNFYFTKYDAEVIFKYFDKENGSLNKDLLKVYLKEEYQNDDDLEKQYTYLINRIEKNIKIGTISINEHGNFVITKKGNEEAFRVKYPANEVIKNKLDYLESIGVLERKDNKYQINIEKSQLLLNKSKNTIIPKDILKLVDNFNGKINRELLISNVRERASKTIPNMKAEKTYEELKKNYKIPDLTFKVIKNISRTLFIADTPKHEVKETISKLLDKSGITLEKGMLDTLVDRMELVVHQSKLWGRIDVINQNDWKELFKSLNQEKAPEWIYKSAYPDYNRMDLSKSFEAMLAQMKNEIRREQQKAEGLKDRESKRKSAERKWLDKSNDIAKSLKRKILDKKKKDERER